VKIVAYKGIEFRLGVNDDIWPTNKSLISVDARVIKPNNKEEDYMTVGFFTVNKNEDS